MACMASVLLGVRPYEVDFRWMGWSRQLVMFQLAVAYALKLSGCACMYADTNTRPMTFVRALGIFWLILYIGSPVCLLAGFFWCLLTQQADLPLSVREVDDAIQMTNNPLASSNKNEEVDMVANPMNVSRQIRRESSKPRRPHSGKARKKELAQRMCHDSDEEDEEG